MTNINLIVAVDQNFGIGAKGTLPWHIPDELRLFREKTKDGVLITGFNTACRLPTLPGRTVNYVSRKCRELLNPLSTSMVGFSSFEQALDSARETNRPIWVIGGASLYGYVLRNYKHDCTVHISFIHAIYECDTVFRADLSDFQIQSETKHEKFTHCVLTHNPCPDTEYIRVVRAALDGESYEGRNGTVLGTFGASMKFDLRQGFPALTTKKLAFQAVVKELLFFLSGETDSKILEAQGVNIWKGNTSREFLDSNGFPERKEGLMGPMYGWQFRAYGSPYNEEPGSRKGVDQYKEVIDKLISEPGSRRILMTAYNPAQAGEGVLYPCHSIVLHFKVGEGGHLDLCCYNRSSDVGLGLPFNIASTALLLAITAKLTGLTPRYFNLFLGDIHIYPEHVGPLREQASRVPYESPGLCLPESLNSLEDLHTVSFKDFALEKYKHHAAIKMDMVA